MIEPKLFYRKMERLLTLISEHHADSNYLPSILDALERAFGDELHIGRGHLYEEIGGAFELQAHTEKSPSLVSEFSVSSLAAELVIQNGGYIFVSPTEGLELFKSGEASDTVPAAFVVSLTSLRRWMFVFCLEPGWNREEIAFCLNGARFALNSRMRADAAQGDLESAALIQKSLLPSQPPEFPGFEIAARTKPAEAVGGDLYDFIVLSDDILGVAIGDASGHGLPAALLVRDVLMGIRMGTGTHLKMLYTLKKLNRVIHETTLSTRFISVFYSEIEKNGNILYANAGHVPGLLFNDDDVQLLDPTGMILGPIRDIQLDRSYAHIKPGGLLVLFTDGLTERVGKSDEAFDTDGLIELVRQHRALDAESLAEKVFEYALSLNHESDLLEDDATLVVIKRHKA